MISCCARSCTEYRQGPGDQDYHCGRTYHVVVQHGLLSWACLLRTHHSSSSALPVQRSHHVACDTVGSNLICTVDSMDSIYFSCCYWVSVSCSPDIGV